MESQTTFLTGYDTPRSVPENIGDQESHRHCNESHDPQMGVRHFPHGSRPLLHLVWKCEIGETFNYEYKPEQTQ